ncbi:hypothetical protein PTSG_01162 [Salpingoeca rosetta]|uniref:FHA domain-containing protein n=1 Tax=Salpingoeca rosetta (strain ATCC 50818 / BSB-021) TaxID=946362 RepID=F2U0Z6_SALR5|nr:uncharacterized protein PTSG_01162 [Salpingoeca rosetta]EGD80570.1 hypothetical protein PTSG_01162 [Salpingoeca rosetta]|eukprot:XP_004997131.1 hypothetical protein PTSG_01162 [Salpingoeca rosetta]
MADEGVKRDEKGFAIPAGLPGKVKPVVVKRPVASTAEGSKSKGESSNNSNSSGGSTSADVVDKEKQQQPEVDHSGTPSSAASSQPGSAEAASPAASPSSTSAAASSPNKADKGPPGRDEIYTAPEWSRVPTADYKLEVLKGGRIIDTIDISKKPFYIVGRAPICDIQAEHPSISRCHTVLQHGDDGFVYAYDLNSTHGTKLNKTKMPPKRYYRFRIGQMLRFGASTRLYILSGPEELEAQESARLETQEDAIRERQAKKLEDALKARDQGVTWGVDESEPEDTDTAGGDADVLAAIAKNIETHGPDFDQKAFYRKDPQRALKHYLTQVGEDLEFEFDQMQMGRTREYVATIELPIYDVNGRGMKISGQGERKKEAMESCCLNACRALDAKNLLRDTQSARKFDDDDDDVYGGDDDNDEFYDRTGDVQRKRAKRQQRSGAVGSQKDVQTAETLEAKKSSLEAQISNLETEIEALEKTLADQEEEGLDEVDSYVKGLQAKTTKSKIKKMRKEVDQLQMDLKQTQQLLKFLRPSLSSTT